MSRLEKLEGPHSEAATTASPLGALPELACGGKDFGRGGFEREQQHRDQRDAAAAKTISKIATIAAGTTVCTMPSHIPIVASVSPV